jgi:hypothetical protein
MSTAALRGKLGRLRRDLGPVVRDGEQCPKMYVGGLVSYCPGDGEPRPVINEDDYPQCPTCGQVHVVVLEEVIVEPGKPSTPSAAGGEARCP